MTHLCFSGFLQEAGDEGWMFLHEQVQAHHQEPLHLLHSPRLQVHLLIGQSLQEQHLTSCHTLHALKTFLVIDNVHTRHMFHSAMRMLVHLDIQVRIQTKLFTYAHRKGMEFAWIYNFIYYTILLSYCQLFIPYCCQVVTNQL